VGDLETPGVRDKLKAARKGIRGQLEGAKDEADLWIGHVV
jgi:hypothetical protein